MSSLPQPSTWPLERHERDRIITAWVRVARAIGRRYQPAPGYGAEDWQSEAVVALVRLVDAWTPDCPMPWDYYITRGIRSAIYDVWKRVGRDAGVAPLSYDMASDSRDEERVEAHRACVNTHTIDQTETVTRIALRQALDTLSDDERIVLDLLYDEGLSMDQIAIRLRLADRRQVGNTKKAALRKLRAALDVPEPEQPVQETSIADPNRPAWSKLSPMRQRLVDHLLAGLSPDDAFRGAGYKAATAKSARASLHSAVQSAAVQAALKEAGYAATPRKRSAYDRLRRKQQRYVDELLAGAEPEEAVRLAGYHAPTRAIAMKAVAALRVPSVEAALAEAGLQTSAAPA